MSILRENLIDAIENDFDGDHAAKYKAIKKARKDLFFSMHESQQKAIQDMAESVKSVLSCYHEMYHPSFDDIVKLDSAFWQFVNDMGVIDD